jgi:hypothetical protein
MSVTRGVKIRIAGVAMPIMVFAALLAAAEPAHASLLPNPPRGLAASPYNGHSINVWWQPGALGDSYIIQARRGTSKVLQTSCKCASLRLDGLAPSTTYSVQVWTKNASGVQSAWPSTVDGITTFGPGAPDPPQAVTAASDPNAPTIHVSWTPPAGGDPASFVDISAVPVGSTVAERLARCMLAPSPVHQCVGNTATIVGLIPARQYVVYVAYGSTSAVGLAEWSEPVTVASGCPGESPYCLSVNGTTASGNAGGPAAGLLHSGDNVNQQRLQPLRVSNWRISVAEFPSPPGTFDFTAYESAMTTNASITLVLSDAWATYSRKYDASPLGVLLGNTAAHATPPWYDWNAYSDWVTRYVTTVEQRLQTRGWRLPDYWEVMNEPDGLRDGGYLSSADAGSATLNNVEVLFEKTYAAVKAADPAAHLLGPSLGVFAAAPGWDPERLDLATFLAYSADPAHPLRWDGLAWHEIAPKTETDWTTNPEEVVANHAAAVRALLARHPSLGSPPLTINEYGPPDRWVVPGWQVGFIDAVEHTGIAQAAHSCFGSWNHDKPSHGRNCSETTSTLNGQLANDGVTTYPIYWVSRAYAAMSYDAAHATATTVVASRASHPSFGVFATRNPATSSVTALIGRHQTCVGGTNADCGETAAAPVDVPLTVSFPYAAPAGVRVRVERIPLTYHASPIEAPLLLLDRVVALTGGQVTVTLPQFADGDALVVTVMPA